MDNYGEIAVYQNEHGQAEKKVNMQDGAAWLPSGLFGTSGKGDFTSSQQAERSALRNSHGTQLGKQALLRSLPPSIITVGKVP